MTSKSLTTEIEQLRRTHSQKRLHLTSAPSPLRPLHQYELGIPDRSILFDVLKLTFSFLDRDQSSYSGPERARVEAFLRLFIPLLLGVPHSEMEENLAHSNEPPEAEADDGDGEGEGEGETGRDVEGEDENEAEEFDSEAEANGTSDVESSNGTDMTDSGTRSPSRASSSRNGPGVKGGAADLRKRLLVHAATTAGRDLPSMGLAMSRTVSPDLLAVEQPVEGDDQTWAQLDELIANGTAIEGDGGERRFNFFANTTFYCLARIIHVSIHVSTLACGLAPCTNIEIESTSCRHCILVCQISRLTPRHSR